MLIELLKTMAILAAVLGLWIGICGGGGGRTCGGCGSGCATPCKNGRDTNETNDTNQIEES